MTLLATNGRKVIHRIHLAGESRWVSLALSLGELASGSRFLVGAEHLLYEMAGADDAARKYGLSNWQGGVISGARYAFRALKAPVQQVCLHELRGQLSSGDVWAISSAAALAVARLLARPDVPLDLGGWILEEPSRTQVAEGIGQGAKVDSIQSEPPQERADNLSSASEKKDADQGTQAIPAAPDGGVDAGS
jgi:hypothetical protein